MQSVITEANIVGYIIYFLLSGYSSRQRIEGKQNFIMVFYLHRNFYKHFSFIVNLLLILILLAPQLVSAKSTTVQENHITFTLSDLGYTTDDEVQGVLVSRQYDVNLPLNWELTEPAKITLRFSHSPSLNTHSSVVADWNGTRIGSTLLDDSNVTDGQLLLEVPSGLLQPGFNQLSVEFFMGIRDDFCEDFDNPAVWAVVHSSSSFNMSYVMQSPDVNLYGYPERLIDPSPLVQNDITLVLPEDPAIAELNAAALVSAKLGQFADWRTLNLNAIPLDEVSEETKGNLIFVGMAAQLAEANPILVPGMSVSGGLEDEAGKAIASDAGVLWLQASPAADGSMWLSVTGVDEAGLEKAAGAFATTSLFDRYSGSLAVIVDVPDVSEDVDSTSDLVYTLADLGYSDIVSRGNRQQSSYLNIPIQTVFDSLGDASLVLRFSHSEVLNEDRSSMDILLNDVPVSSIKLSDSNAENATEAINIPLRLFKLGDNTLTIVSNIQVTNSVVESTLYCTDEYYSDSWLTIDSNSTLTFPSGVSQYSASLTGYPGFYFGGPAFSNLAFVVPDAPDWATTSAVLEIANRIGRVSVGDAIDPAVVSSSALRSMDNERPYQILVGLPEQNNAIMDLNEILPQSFDKETYAPMPLKGIATVLSSDSLGYIESLFTEDGDYRLIVTATSAEGLAWAANALNTPEMFQLFEGNLAILSGDEEIAFYTLASSTSLVTNEPVRTPIADTNASPYPSWVIILAISILVLSVGVVLVSIFTRKS
jgi:cellulose synthase operon protein B